MPFFDPSQYLSGPVTITRQICELQAQRGHDVAVVTTDTAIVDPSMPRNQWGERDGYRVYYAATNAWSSVPPYWCPAARDAMDEAIAKADVVHLHVSLTMLNVQARTVAQKHGVPYILSPRGVLDAPRLKDRRLSKLAFMTLFEKRVLRDAAAIHALTAKERDQVIRLGACEDQIEIIPNAVDMGAPSDWPDPTTFRRTHDIAEDAVVVLYLGRLMTIKGIDLLVEAFAQVSQDLPDAVLVMAGPDHKGQGAAARRQARHLGIDSRIRWVGPVTGEQKLAAYRAADIFTLPSRSEGLPNAVLEAAAMGLPLLITDECNIPEVAEYDAGRVVTPDAAAITRALNQLLIDSSLRIHLSHNARQVAQERFAIRNVIDRLVCLYGRLSPRSDRP